MSIALSGEWSSIAATALVSLLGFLVASLVRSKLREAGLQARFLESSKKEDLWREKALKANDLIDEATDLADEWKKKNEDQASVILQKTRRIDELQDRLAALKALADEAAIHKANRQDLLAQLAKAEENVSALRQEAGRNRKEALKIERELVAAQAENRVLFANNQAKQTLLDEMEAGRKRDQEKADAAIKRLTLDREGLRSQMRSEHAKEIADLREQIKALQGRIYEAWQEREQEQEQEQDGGLREKMRRIWGD